MYKLKTILFLTCFLLGAHAKAKKTHFAIEDTTLISNRLNKNLFNFDVSYLPLTSSSYSRSFTISYSRKLNEKWYIGGGAGGGVSWVWIINWDDYMWEVINVKIFSLYLPYKNIFQIESGIQASLNGWGGKGDDDMLFGGVYGIYLLPTIGFKNFKIGFKPFIGTLGFDYGLFYINPIIFRLNFLF